MTASLQHIFIRQDHPLSGPQRLFWATFWVCSLAGKTICRKLT